LIKIFKLIGIIIIYPGFFLIVSLKLAKFHFEKDIKKQYLLAKDKVANDLIISMTNVLHAMWERYNIKNLTETGPNLEGKRQTAYILFKKNLQQSYIQLGQMGLYYGTDVVEDVAKLQDEWAELLIKMILRSLITGKSADR
jgi:hypothetical protein